MPTKIILQRPPDVVLALYNTTLLVMVRNQSMGDTYYRSGLASADAIRLHAWMTAAAEYEDQLITKPLRVGWQQVINEFSKLTKLSQNAPGVMDDLKIALHDATKLVLEAVKRQYGVQVGADGRR